MWKLKDPVTIGDDALDTVYPVQGRWDYRNGTFFIQPSLALKTEKGICLGEYDMRGNTHFVEFPILNPPINTSAFSEADEEMKEGVELFERALEIFMRGALKKIQARADIPPYRVKVGRKEYVLDFSWGDRKPDVDRAYIEIIKPDK